MQEEIVWALVLDSSQARILRDVRRKGAANLLEPSVLDMVQPELLLVAAHHDLRNVATERFPQAVSAGGSQFAMADDDGPTRVAESRLSLHEYQRSFAIEIITLLESHRRAGDFHRLAVFAAPPMLETLRLQLTKGLAATLIAKVPENRMLERPAALLSNVRRHLFAH